jgi:hypothetical protein
MDITYSHINIRMRHQHYDNNLIKKVSYDNLFNKASRYPYLVQHGRGQLTPFMGKRHQRGYGLGNILSGLFRTIIPLMKPVLKTAARTIGRRVLKGGVKIAKNVLKGKGLKKELKREAQEGLSELKSRANSALNKKNEKNKNNKRRRLNPSSRSDIFN